MDNYSIVTIQCKNVEIHSIIDREEFIMNAPCKDCADRFVGCHATCEKYNQYSIKNERLKRERFIIKGNMNAIDELAIKRSRKR